MRGLIFFLLYSIFQATSERQTWAQERQHDRLSLFFSIPITHNNTHSLSGKKVFFLWKKGHWEAKRGLVLEKVGERVWSDGIVQGLFLLRTSLYSRLTSVYMSRGRECSDTDLDIHARCFLLISYCLSQLSFPWCSALMSEDRQESVNLRECGDGVWFCFSVALWKSNWEKLSWRDEIIRWRQKIMNQGVVVN